MPRPIQDPNLPYQLGQSFTIKGGLDGMALDEIIVPVAVVRDFTGGGEEALDPLPPSISTDPRRAWAVQQHNAPTAQYPLIRLVNPASRRKVLRVYRVIMSIGPTIATSCEAWIVSGGVNTTLSSPGSKGGFWMDRPSGDAAPVGRLEEGHISAAQLGTLGAFIATLKPLASSYGPLSTVTFDLGGFPIGPGDGLACLVNGADNTLAAAWEWTEEDAPANWPTNTLVP